MWKCKSQERDVWVSSWGRHYIKDLKTDHLISIIQYLRWRAAKELNLTKKGLQVFDEFIDIPYKRMRADITRYLHANVIPWSCLVDEYAKRIGLPYWVRPGIEDWKKRYITGVDYGRGKSFSKVIVDEVSAAQPIFDYYVEKARKHAENYRMGDMRAKEVVNESRYEVLRKTLESHSQRIDSEAKNREMILKILNGHRTRFDTIEQRIESLTNQTRRLFAEVGEIRKSVAKCYENLAPAHAGRAPTEQEVPRPQPTIDHDRFDF